MNTDYKKIAKRFLELNLNPVPVEREGKKPIREAHQTSILKEEIDNFNWPQIGVSTGYASNNLEALDFDLKNVDNPKEVLQEFSDLVGKELLKKLVVQSTPSGGYHFVYRCDTIESNKKLAKNEDGKAIIETRGIGGYIKCFPSEGYNMVKLDFSKIPFITSEERFNLFVAAKKLNRLIKEDTLRRIPEDQASYQSKFPDYDDDIEIGLSLLEEAGWTEHSRIGEWVNYTRPDKSISDGMSGGYNIIHKFFFAFSTSQDTFITERPYANHQIFAEVKCEGDYTVAYAKLFKDGHGVEEDENLEVTFLSSEKEEDDYLEQARKGEIELGLTTGWPSLDPYFRLKRNSFNFFLGLDNIGKSILLSNLMVSSRILHGCKWGISSPEAMNFVTRRDLIEVTTGRPLKALKEEPDLYYNVLNDSRKYYYIIRNDKHYTIDEVLEKGKVLYTLYGIDYLLIDPYSFYSGSGNFKEDTEILSKIRVFCQRYCGVVVVDHPFTGFTRTRDEHGYIPIPTKYDASGGNVKPNKCDDFVSLHRIINHESDILRRSMYISVQKVKDKSTGGKPHIDGEYSTLIWEERNGFIGYWDENGNNPIYEYLSSKYKIKKITGLYDKTDNNIF